MRLCMVLRTIRQNSYKKKETKTLAKTPLAASIQEEKRIDCNLGIDLGRIPVYGTPI